MNRHTFLITPFATALWLAVATSPVAAQEVDSAMRSDWAAAAAVAGEFDKAHAIAARISRLRLRDSAYRRIAIVRAGVGTRAIDETLARIGNAGRRKAATVDVAIILARRGDLEGAERLASGLDPVNRDTVLAVTAMMRAEAGDDQAVQETLSAIEFGSRRRAARELVSAGFARSRAPGAARDYALEAKDRRERVFGLIAVARAQAADGDKKNAILTLARAREEMRDGGLARSLESRLMSDTAVILAGVGDFEGARQARDRVANATLRAHLRRYINAVERYWPR